MMPLVKNRYIDALLKLMLLSSIIHMVALALYSVTYNDFGPFNFFTIVGIDLLFPQIITSDCQYVYSFATVLCLYAVIFYILNRKKKS